MKTEKTEKYTLLADDRNDFDGFVKHLESVVPKKFAEDHLVIDLSSNETLELSQLLAFIKLSTYHRSTKHSFVIVNQGVDIDEIPDELVVVPTLQEAADIIEMEEIERDLGF
ncbi:ribonuclease Z [Aureisphaera galaxeae]|uniref:ribonuclease Z n=1 Tax=Aureisphaera galaxeae TaxID=1538023 RepID=UPI002350C376|nr:ribonuclease Z [Aureisphaera galaxeae]MDC8004074.1 ribonuclease Z [Aureisphaera galaxeae]